MANKNVKGNMYVSVHLGHYNRVVHKQQKSIVHSSRGWKSKTKVQADSVPSKGSPPGSESQSSFSLSPHGKMGKGTFWVSFIRIPIQVQEKSHSIRGSLS